MRRTSLKTVLVDRDELLKALQDYMAREGLETCRKLYRKLGFRSYQAFYYFRRKVEEEGRVGIRFLKRVCDVLGEDYRRFIKEG